MDWRNRPKHNVGRGGVRPRLSYPSLGSTCLGLDPPLTSCPPRWLLPGLCQGLPSVVACLLPLPVACGDQAFFNLPFISRPRPSEIGFDVGPAPRGGNQGFLRPGLDSDHCPQPRRGPEVSWPSGQDPESDPPTHTHKVPDLQAHGRAATWAPKWRTGLRSKSFVTTLCDLFLHLSPRLLPH